MVAFFSDSLSAGFPSAAEGYEDEPLNIHDWLVTHPAATFFFRMRGEMTEEHICNGSILVVDRSIRPRPGKLVVAEASGAFVVARYQPEIYEIVLGVVVGVVRKF